MTPLKPNKVFPKRHKYIKGVGDYCQCGLPMLDIGHVFPKLDGRKGKQVKTPQSASSGGLLAKDEASTHLSTKSLPSDYLKKWQDDNFPKGGGR